MKSAFTILLVLAAAIRASGQGSADYYQKIYARPLGSKPLTVESLLRKFGDVHVLNRWYTGINGFISTDKNTIHGDFDGLISTYSPTVSSWSVIAGWVHHESWIVEAEYARSAVHNNLVINGDNPMTYLMTNDKNNLMLRGKMRLLRGKAGIQKSAFWIGGGAGVIPNSGRQKEYMEFYGYRLKGRSLGRDTLSVSSSTRVSTRPTWMAEVSIEYMIRMAKWLDCAVFARKQWGFSNSLTTDLVYTSNSQKEEYGRIAGNGTGLKLGISLRYIIHVGYDFSALKPLNL